MRLETEEDQAEVRVEQSIADESQVLLKVHNPEEGWSTDGVAWLNQDEARQVRDALNELLGDDQDVEDLTESEDEVIHRLSERVLDLERQLQGERSFAEIQTALANEFRDLLHESFGRRVA